MSLRSGTFAFVSLVFASACACTGAVANGMHADDGFRPVSEEFRGNARPAADETMRSNSIRTDVSRYNAERSSPPRPTNAGDPSRPLPQMRNGYRSN